jgi:exopolysaccharide biosynthesis polyprenyl glycosylphosphotransferase
MTVDARRVPKIISGKIAAHAPWEISYSRRLLYTDTLAVVGSVFGAQILWVKVHAWIVREPAIAAAAQPFATLYSIGLITLWLGYLMFFGSRDSRALGVGFTEFRRMLQASFATFGTLAVIVYLFNLQLARGYFFIALPTGLLLLLTGRRLWRDWLCAQRREGEYSHRVMLVGSAVSVTHIARELRRMPQAGFVVLGACVPAGQEEAEELGPEVPIVGDFADLMTTVESVGADTVIITSSDELSPPRIRELSWQLEPGQQHLIVAPNLTDIGGPRIHTRPVAGLPLIHVETPRFSGGKTHTKRIFDIVATSAMLIILLPAMVAIAGAVRLGSPGPVLFRQHRIGKNGRPFHILKFRSMVPDAEARLEVLRAQANAGNDILFKMKDDPRITPVGRILRRYSLDELPQLFNVLTGEMSLIGPRPPLASEVEEYEHHVHRRFLVKPGITGPWQVSGRSNLSWEESVRLDLSYVENWTLTGDLVILLRTAQAVLARDGAY